MKSFKEKHQSRVVNQTSKEELTLIYPRKGSNGTRVETANVDGNFIIGREIGSEAAGTGRKTHQLITQEFGATAG